MKKRKMFWVVLTGCPGSGKSSVLPCLASLLREEGYLVFVLHEAVTQIKNLGLTYDLFGSVFLYQKLITTFQFKQEEILRQESHLCQPCIVLLDRCIVDGQMYCSNDEWERILVSLPTLEMDTIYFRYDQVFLLDDAFNQADMDFSSHMIRKENRDEIADLRKRLKSIWSEYPYCIDIPWADTVEEKAQIIKRHIVERYNS